MELSFGKKLKVLRIYNSETTIDMAKKLGISISYLSAIENGKRKVPDDFLDKLFKSYQIDKKDQAEFRNALDKAQKEVTIKLENLKKEQQDFALLCARSIEELSNDEMDAITKIILKNK